MSGDNPWLVPTDGQMPKSKEVVEILIQRNGTDGLDRVIRGVWLDNEDGWSDTTTRQMLVGERIIGWRTVTWRSLVKDDYMLSVIKNVFIRDLSDSDRLEFIQENFPHCKHCGSLNDRCQCSNDD